MQFLPDSIRMLSFNPEQLRLFFFTSSHPLFLSEESTIMKTALTIKVNPPQFTEYVIPSRPEQPPADLEDADSSADEDNPHPSQLPLARPQNSVNSTLADFAAEYAAPDPSQRPAASNPNSPFALVFSLKEFRAMLYFTFGIGAPLTLTFTQPSQFVSLFSLISYSLLFLSFLLLFTNN